MLHRVLRVQHRWRLAAESGYQLVSVSDGKCRASTMQTPQWADQGTFEWVALRTVDCGSVANSVFGSIGKRGW